MSPFTAEVIRIIKSIPRGRVLTYGQVALMAGHPRAARQVVWTLKTQTAKHSLPWQRVLGKGGVIKLAALQGREEQIYLLEQEGIFLEEGIVPMDQYVWEKWENWGES
jgi:methylated-DNA-protein-cysteine methyltransferase-like protein